LFDIRKKVDVGFLLNQISTLIVRKIVGNVWGFLRMFNLLVLWGFIKYYSPCHIA